MLLGVNIDNRSAVTRQGLELPANRSEYEWYIVPAEYEHLNFGVSFVESDDGVKPVLMLDGQPVDEEIAQQLQQECYLDPTSVIELVASKTELTTGDQLDVSLQVGGEPIAEDVEIQVFEAGILVGRKVGTSISIRFSKPGRYKVTVKDKPCVPAEVYVQDSSVQII